MSLADQLAAKQHQSQVSPLISHDVIFPFKPALNNQVQKRLQRQWSLMTVIFPFHICLSLWDRGKLVGKLAVVSLCLRIQKICIYQSETGKYNNADTT